MPQLALIQYQIKTEPPPSAVVVDLPGRLESPWHQAWTLPVRVRISPRLAVALGASGGLWSPSLTFPSLFFESNRHFPWSEPVRQKPGLRAGLQQFYISEPFGMLAPEATTESRWHYRWEEPQQIRVTFKPPLRTGEYPFFFAPPRLLPNPDLTAVMAATETNNDVAMFDLNVYTPVPGSASLSGAKVSIVEEGVPEDSVSIREVE